MIYPYRRIFKPKLQGPNNQTPSIFVNEQAAWNRKFVEKKIVSKILFEKAGNTLY